MDYPWFGIFIPNKHKIVIEAKYKSPLAITIAIECGQRIWPGEIFSIRWADEDEAIAGFIPRL